MRQPAASSGSHLVPVLLAVTLVAAAAVPSLAFAQMLRPGDPAPPFDLPFLAGEGGLAAPDLFWESRVTALVLWNRACPQCAEIVTAMPALADSLLPLGGRVAGLAFGPDDPAALRAWLADQGITLPQLWDDSGSVASLYGLGLSHLAVFVVDESGVVRAVFDDNLEGLVESVVPAARAATRPVTVLEPGPGTRSDATPPRRAPSNGSLPGALRLDGRMRLLSSQKVRTGDVGLFGETLENGSVLLYRWDLRYSWRVTPELEFVPWLRVSNESDEVLAEGPEQLSDPRGSASLIARSGESRATLGAFPLRLSPLLLQRWDAQDAPPLGGVSSCGCGAGATGVRQRSLEVLSPYYTFEGIAAGHSTALGSVQTFFSIPRWERAVSEHAPVEQWDLARYRRILYGTAVDLGPTLERDPDFELPSPLGLRFSIERVDDDERTLGPGQRHPQAQDQWGWSVLGRVGLLDGMWADGEYAASHADLPAASTAEEDAAALRAGLNGRARGERFSLWARAHRLRVEAAFAPQYRALTYDPNREGWRVAGGIGWRRHPSDRRDAVALSAFLRDLDEIDEVSAGFGRNAYRVASLSLTLRPRGDLPAQVHAVRTRTDRPHNLSEKTEGLSLDLRWEGSPSIDPMLRIDAIRRDPVGRDPARTYWQGSLSIRVVV